MAHKCGAISARRARALSAVRSAPRRDRTKVKVRAPSATNSAIIRAASAPAERRTGAPFSPRMSSRSSGSQSAMVREPCGEPSWVTSATGRPISSAAVAPGDAVVALAKMTVGPAVPGELYRAAKRSNRRRTMATLDPKIPR